MSASLSRPILEVLRVREQAGSSGDLTFTCRVRATIGLKFILIRSPMVITPTEPWRVCIRLILLSKALLQPPGLQLLIMQCLLTQPWQGEKLVVTVAVQIKAPKAELGRCRVRAMWPNRSLPKLPLFITVPTLLP